MLTLCNQVEEKYNSVWPSKTIKLPQIAAYVEGQYCNLIHYTHNYFERRKRPELAKYLHWCLWSPPNSSLIKSINNNQLEPFPGLKPELITKHLTPYKATDKGHMHITRMNIRYIISKNKQIKDSRLYLKYINPTQQMFSAFDIYWFASLEDISDGDIYTDGTGIFLDDSTKICII